MGCITAVSTEDHAPVYNGLEAMRVYGCDPVLILDLISGIGGRGEAIVDGMLQKSLHYWKLVLKDCCVVFHFLRQIGQTGIAKAELADSENS